MLLSDEKYGRQHDHYNKYHHATEYELFLKPHHRLDRKSSRGMIYENEELRLRTININAEIERGQYDIKKLKKENELLKKEIWCLRDEYEKLDKLLKEKNIDFSSSSTTSESDSCSSCLDESDDVENSQNLENDQKTNLRNLSRNFAALSIVPEESTENSDRTSPRTSLVNDPAHPDADVIQADQSYPSYEQSGTLRMRGGLQSAPKNFFSPERLEAKEAGDQTAIPPSENYEDVTHQVMTPCNGDIDDYHQYTSNKIVNTEATSFYQNIVLVPNLRSHPESETLEKTGTDVLAKTDNRNFAPEPNGGGLDYIAQFADDFPRYYQNFGANSRSTFSNGGNLEELLNDIETISQDILAMSNSNQMDLYSTSRRCKSDINPGQDKTGQQQEKPFKSELNVTLMPQPMALIGLEKYKDIQRSMNTTPSKSLENLSTHAFQDNHMTEKREFNHFQQSSTDISDFSPIRPLTPNLADHQHLKHIPNLPPYLGNLKDNYVSGDYFARYNPEHFSNSERSKPVPKIMVKQVSLDQPSSENEEHTKIKQEIKVQNEQQKTKKEEPSKKEEKQKIGLRKKVSIHFRGKKDKQKNLEIPTNTIIKHSPVRDKKTQEDPKNEKTKINHQKTSSKDSNKTTSESDTKNNPETRKTVEKSDNEKKPRKSASVSPDRRKKEDKKCKKHKKDRIRLRRATVTSLESRDQRARSHSVNTDRSNTYGGSHFFFDDYMNSERDSMSSSETLKTKQMHFSNVPMAGKVPWCGCWGNGCI